MHHENRSELNLRSAAYDPAEYKFETHQTMYFLNKNRNSSVGQDATLSKAVSETLPTEHARYLTAFRCTRLIAGIELTESLIFRSILGSRNISKQSADCLQMSCQSADGSFLNLL